jgi:hypothetical protein
MALLNEGIHSNYYAYKLLIKYFLIYKVYEEVFKHYYTYKHLGTAVDAKADQAFNEQHPIHHGLIQQLKRARHFTWHYVAPTIISASLCFNWLRYTRENTPKLMRIVKTLHYSALTSSFAMLAPFYFTYAFDANRKICFDTTHNYYKFMMKRVEPNWEDYIQENGYFKMRPKTAFRY